MQMCISELDTEVRWSGFGRSYFRIDGELGMSCRTCAPVGACGPAADAACHRTRDLLSGGRCGCFWSPLRLLVGGLLPAVFLPPPSLRW